MILRREVPSFQCMGNDKFWREDHVIGNFDNLQNKSFFVRNLYRNRGLSSRRSSVYLH
jgi:hypothetical protein